MKKSVIITIVTLILMVFVTGGAAFYFISERLHTPNNVIFQLKADGYGENFNTNIELLSSDGQNISEFNLGSTRKTHTEKLKDGDYKIIIKDGKDDTRSYNFDEEQSFSVKGDLTYEVNLRRRVDE